MPRSRHPSTGRIPVVVFVVLTFAISWGAWIALAVVGGDPLQGTNLVLYLIGGFGPLLAAVVMRFVIERRPAPRVVGAVRRPVWVWASAALALGAGPYLIGILAGLPFGEGPVAADTAEQISSSGGPIIAIILLVIAGPLSEEPGWRGYAHPRIRSTSSRIRTALVLAPIWAAWHLPLFLVDGSSQNATGLFGLGFIYFVVSCLPQTYLIGYMYERGGVAAAVLVHFGINATATLLQVSQPIENSVTLVITFAAAVALELRARAKQRMSPPGNPGYSAFDRSSAP